MIITEMSTLERLEDHEIRSEYGSETLKYDIAAALVAARKMKKLTQIALANIAGVSQAYIAKLESGEANPTIGRIGAILASIWLKAEINLVPIVPIFGAEVATQSNTNQVVDASIPSRSIVERQQWIDMQQPPQMKQFSFNRTSLKSAILLPSPEKEAVNAFLTDSISGTNLDVGITSDMHLLNKEIFLPVQ